MNTIKALLTKKKKKKKPGSLPDETETNNEDSSSDNIASTVNLNNQESLHQKTLEGPSEPSSSFIADVSSFALTSDISGLSDDPMRKYNSSKTIYSSETSAETRRKELFLRDQMTRNLAAQVLQVNEDEFCKIMDALEARFGRAETRAAIGYLTFACDGVTDKEVGELYKLEDSVPQYVVPKAFPDIKQPVSQVWLDIRQTLKGLVLERFPANPSTGGVTEGYLTWHSEVLRGYAAKRFTKSEIIKVHALMAEFFVNLDTRGRRQAHGIMPMPLVHGRRQIWLEKSDVNIRRCVEGVYHLVRAKMIMEAAKEVALIYNTYP